MDGLVGPNTNAQLFEVTTLTVPLLFMPNLGLTPGRGIQPPRLIPPLQWLGPPFLPPPPFQLGGSFRLDPKRLSFLPDFNAPANALGLSITIPTRKDPQDPFVASRLQIVELIDDLPFNSKFKAFLASKVPQAKTTILPPETGFQWGVTPLFDPFDPTGLGVKGNAAFMFKVSEGSDGKPNVTFGAWGDGKFFLDFTGRQGQSRPKVEAQGQLFLGVQGVF